MGLRFQLWATFKISVKRRNLKKLGSGGSFSSNTVRKMNRIVRREKGSDLQIFRIAVLIKLKIMRSTGGKGGVVKKVNKALKTLGASKIMTFI